MGLEPGIDCGSDVTCKRPGHKMEPDENSVRVPRNGRAQSYAGG